MLKTDVPLENKEAEKSLWAVQFLEGRGGGEGTSGLQEEASTCSTSLV